MSPSTLIFPVMNAVIGFCFPARRRSKTSSFMLITHSAGSFDSVTVAAPSSTATFQLPAPWTSKR
jgi:hypothetical protein